MKKRLFRIGFPILFFLLRLGYPFSAKGRIMSTILYNGYKNKRKFWKEVLDKINRDNKAVMFTEYEDFDNLPGDIDYIIDKAKKAGLLILSGGCSMAQTIRHEIALNKFSMLMSKIKEPIEIKVAKKILESKLYVTLYLNDDAKIAISIES